MSEATDDDLILALSGSGRAAAVESLYRRYAPRFTAYLRRRGLSAADAEDAVQEAFIRLIRRAEGFAPQGRGSAWIWTVARSAWLDLARKPARDLVADATDGEAHGAASPDKAANLSFEDCVEGQLSRFSLAYPEGGQAISWAAVDGLPTAEIATLLGRSAGAAREFLSQTRKRLREYLDPCLGMHDRGPL